MRLQSGIWTGLVVSLRTATLEISNKCAGCITFENKRRRVEALCGGRCMCSVIQPHSSSCARECICLLSWTKRNSKTNNPLRVPALLSEQSLQCWVSVLVVLWFYDCVCSNLCFTVQCLTEGGSLEYIFKVSYLKKKKGFWNGSSLTIYDVSFLVSENLFLELIELMNSEN